MNKLFAFKNKLKFRSLLSMCMAVLVVLGGAPPALAATSFSSYSPSSTYVGLKSLTVQNGTLWYIETDINDQSHSYIGNMSTSGVVLADYDLATPSMPTGFSVYSLAAGADGNIWFNGQAGVYVYVGCLDTTTGTITYFSAGPSTTYSSLGRLTATPDGYLWYSIKSNAAQNYSYIIRVDISTGSSTIGSGYTFDNQAIISSLATASDGTLWYSNSYYNTVHRGNTPYIVPTSASQPGQLAAGANGDMWFIEGANGKIGKVTSNGSFAEFAPPAGYAAQLTAGTDGSMWFLENSSAGKIGRITNNGFISEYTLPSGATSPTYLTNGPDGNLWFIAANQVWRLSATPDFTQYSLTSSYSATGPVTVANGTIWYVETSSSTASVIGNMTTSGTILADYNVGAATGAPANFSIKSLVTGADGNVWFHGLVSNKVYVGSLNVTTGAVTFFGAGPIQTYSTYGALVAGTDGKLWYSIKTSSAPSYTYLISTDPSTGVSSIGQSLDTYANVTSIGFSPGGVRWYSDYYFNYVRTTGITQLMPVKPSTPGALTFGADGKMWLVENGKLANITTGGVFTEYAPAGINPNYNLAPGVSGSDAAIWFAEGTTSNTKISKITSSGIATQYPLPAGTTYPRSITGGPDDAMWFSASGKIWKLSY